MNAIIIATATATTTIYITARLHTAARNKAKARHPSTRNIIDAIYNTKDGPP